VTLKTGVMPAENKIKIIENFKNISNRNCYFKIVIIFHNVGVLTIYEQQLQP